MSATKSLFDTSNIHEGTFRQHRKAKDRARLLAIRCGRPFYVQKVSFRDMSPAYRVQADRPDSVAFTARPVGADLSPERGFWKLNMKRTRAGLYWHAMERVCEETPPPTGTVKAKYARRIWKRDRRILIQLRKWRALGEKPSGKYAWITDLLENDVVSALERGGDTSYRPREDGTIEMGGDTPIAFHILNFLRRRWSKQLRWGDEATVGRHARKGGDLTHYSHPGLSSPPHEILRQFQIMRRFQERKKACQEALRKKFGFDFIEPPSGMYYDCYYPGRKRLLDVL